MGTERSVAADQMESPRRKLCFKPIASESSGTLTLNVFWVMLQLLLFSVEGRQTPPVRVEARPCADENTETCSNLSYRNSGPAFTMSATAPPSSSRVPSHRNPDQSSFEPLSATIIAIGAFAGFVFIGAICYILYRKWAQMKDESGWLPKDASRGEILELIELIRIGVIDAEGAPLHVINWMVHGADAPWPPLDGVKSLQRRRRGNCWINSSAVGDTSIELPQRIQPTRSREQATMGHSTRHIIRKGELVQSHYSATDISHEYPLPPPGLDSHYQASGIILSHPSKQPLNSHATEAEGVMSPYTEMSLHVDSEFDSEVGSRRTTLREPEDLPLTALSPRPLSPRPHRQAFYLSLED